MYAYIADKSPPLHSVFSCNRYMQSLDEGRVSAGMASLLQRIQDTLSSDHFKC